jgi:hypothetical protein
MAFSNETHFGESLRIITNGHPRLIVDAYELSAKERAEFDYLDWPAIDSGNGSATFFRYYGELYDLGDIMRAEGELADLGWHGFNSDSYFSGIAVRYCYGAPWFDDDSVIIARVMS